MNEPTTPVTADRIEVEPPFGITEPRESFVAFAGWTLPLDSRDVTQLNELLKFERDVIALRQAIRRALAQYGDTEGRRILERALQETL